MNKNKLKFFLSSLTIFATLGISPISFADSLRNDPTIREMGNRKSYEPGGSRHLFGSRGNVTKRKGKINTISSQIQAGPLKIENVRMQGKIGYETRFSGHTWQVHAPFDNHGSRSEADRYGKISAGGMTSYTLKWSGTEVHPANGYDGEQGGGYPAPKGARDIYNYNISGSATRTTLDSSFGLPPIIKPFKDWVNSITKPEQVANNNNAPTDFSSRIDYINSQEVGEQQEYDNPDFSLVPSFLNRAQIQLDNVQVQLDRINAQREKDQATARAEYDQKQQESKNRFYGVNPNPNQNVWGQYAERAAGSLAYHATDAIQYSSKYTGIDAVVKISAQTVFDNLPEISQRMMANAAEAAAQTSDRLKKNYPNMAAVVGVVNQAADVLPTTSGAKRAVNAVDEVGDAARQAAKRQGSQRTSGGNPALPDDYYNPSNVDARTKTGTMRSNMQINNILQGTTQRDSTKGRAIQYDKVGDYRNALNDFNSLNVQNVQTRPNGTITGNLPDGRKVNVRPQSDGGEPTLQIQHGSQEIKIRYGSKP